MSLKDKHLKNAFTECDEDQPVARAKPSSKTCPACEREYSPASNLIVCERDGTLLMPTRHFNNVILYSANSAFDNNRFKIEAWIGEGDLTNAFYAIETESQKPVVIKIIKSEIVGGEPRRIRRFANMLQETAKLQHANIVRVLDSGIAQASATAMPQVYVVVEKLKAFKNLKVILREYGTLTPYMVIETMIKVCQTLDDALAMEWLHQDVKPSNIYISMHDEQISVKISDFGVAARMFSNLEWDNQGTKTGSLYGKAAYISPDATYGLEPSVAADVYSLGCTMYHVLKGMPPFEGNNDFSTLMMHRDREPKPFAKELEIPDALETVIMKCLQKKPENRYQNFSDLVRDLNAIA